jgi:hypothetical protein
MSGTEKMIRTTERSALWPDAEDQAICRRFILQDGSDGYAMCYLFGYYRHAGHEREAALALVYKAIAQQQERGAHG